MKEEKKIQKIKIKKETKIRKETNALGNTLIREKINTKRVNCPYHNFQSLIIGCTACTRVVGLNIVIVNICHTTKLGSHKPKMKINNC